jgi:hypothetical protein
MKEQQRVALFPFYDKLSRKEKVQKMIADKSDPLLNFLME